LILLADLEDGIVQSRSIIADVSLYDYARRIGKAKERRLQAAGLDDLFEPLTVVHNALREIPTSEPNYRLTAE
jgi:hypothetical protein